MIGATHLTSSAWPLSFIRKLRRTASGTDLTHTVRLNTKSYIEGLDGHLRTRFGSSQSSVEDGGSLQLGGILRMLLEWPTATG